MRMGTRKRTEVERVLQQKGFAVHGGDHERFQYTSLEGKKTPIWTKVSRGSGHKDIATPNLSKMAKQCHLTNEQFDDLLDCPLSREKYEFILLEKEII